MDLVNKSDERVRKEESRIWELKEQVRNMSDVMKKRRVEWDKRFTLLQQE